MSKKKLFTQPICIQVKETVASSTSELRKGDKKLGLVKQYFILQESIKTDVEGRRKKEEGWNCNGDLNPNAILTPCDGGEFNPYLDVKKLKKETKLDEINLLKSISKGDRTAFWQLWLLHQEYLYCRCVTWMGGDRTNAEEALSLTIMKAWEKLPHYAEKITNLKAWLTRMTHNLCVDLHRKRHKSAMSIESIEEMAVGEHQTLASSEYSPESAILRHELRMYIRRGIEALSPRQREPLILHFYQNMSYPDIAKKLGICVDNVYKRIQQGRKILQKQLKLYLSGIDDSPLLLKEVGNDEIVDEFQWEKSVIPSQNTTTKECNFEQINYQVNYEVTAICLETLSPVW